MKKIIFFLIILNLAIAIAAKATDYYVDASNNGTASGTFGAPWKTIGQVQTAMNSFLPGDNIYFKKALTYTGNLNFTRNGTGQAPITFGTYGTGAKPVITTTSGILLNFYQRMYLVFDGLNITDLTLDTANRSSQAKITHGFNLDQCSYITIKNCDFSLVGVGVNINGNFNTVDNNKFENLRMIKNTVGGDDDYGANPVVITGANNDITNNYFKDCWANSYDYVYDGGAIEFYGPANNANKIEYNTAINCDGFMEIGFAGLGTTSNNVVAYNRIINCGPLVYISNSGQYTTAVTNLQIYNNVIVHTLNQLTLPTSMIGMTTASATANIITFKNNIVWTTTGIALCRPTQWTTGQLVEGNNVYHLGGGSVLNFTPAGSDVTTSAAIWTSTAGGNPLLWDYSLLSGSPAIDIGVTIAGLYKDITGASFKGNPDAGTNEYQGTITTPPAGTGPRTFILASNRYRKFILGIQP